MNYRREIDGLRAIAVVPVILFHAGFEVFSGGFVGVDVFFVISGYLITTIILVEKEKEAFSLVNFYERRARRILPALFTVMLVSSVFAWFTLSPDHMRDFSESLVAVSIFSSNIFFWKEAGYWGVENELKPLLHTWSLAVEEQYYLLFPIFLMLMWRFRKRWIFGSFMVFAVISLAIAHFGSYHYPTPTFFLLPTRGWELAIGAGIAFYFLYHKNFMRAFVSHYVLDDILSIVGFLMIGYSIFFFDENTPFPSIYALVPTIGTGLIIIFSSPKTIIGKILGTRSLVGIGLISYSAYLWHQPLFVFARHIYLTKPSNEIFLLLSGFSIVLAYLSWRLVEIPFRSKSGFTRKHIFGLTVLISAIFIIVGFMGRYSNGWPERIDPKVLSSIKSATENYRIKVSCLSKKNRRGKPCLLIESKNKFVYLYGDSHAGILKYEMKEAIKNTDFGLFYSKTTACPPVKNIYIADSKYNCYERNEKTFQHIENNADIEYVVLVARWTLGMEGSRFNNEEGGIEQGDKPNLGLVTNGSMEYHKDYSHRKQIGQRYIASVRWLIDAGKKVILVYPVPEVGWNVPDYIGKYYRWYPNKVFSLTTGSTSYDVFRRRNRRTMEALDNIGVHPNLYRVYPAKLFCNAGVENRCIVQKDGNLFYEDDNHLSGFGAKLVVDKVTQFIN